jgi:hypothetical protein
VTDPTAGQSPDDTCAGRTLALPAMTSVRLKGNRVSRLPFVMAASSLFHLVPQWSPIRSRRRPLSRPITHHMQEVP